MLLQKFYSSLTFLNNFLEHLLLSHVVIWTYQVIKRMVIYLVIQNIVCQITCPLGFNECLLHV